jgi:hypothetical protein
VSASSKANNSRAALIRRVGSNQISKIFEAPKQTVHGLLAYPCSLGENARADSVWARKAKERHVRQSEPLKARRIQILDDAPVDGLGRNA